MTSKIAYKSTPSPPSPSPPSSPYPPRPSSQQQGATLTESEFKSIERTVIHKLDRTILPIISLVFMASFLDRVNIGHTQLTSIKSDLGISNEQFNWTISIFYFGYTLFEIPSNLLMKRFAPAKWIARICITWGSITVLMTFANSFLYLLLSRLFLGIAEAGMAPGLMFFLSIFYLRHELSTRISIYFSTATMAGAFGGVIAYLLASLDGIGGLKGWQWIFMVEGIPTVLIGFLVWKLLPSYPEEATFLTPLERYVAIERVQRDVLDAAVEDTELDEEIGGMKSYPHHHDSIELESWTQPDPSRISVSSSISDSTLDEHTTHTRRQNLPTTPSPPPTLQNRKQLKWTEALSALTDPLHWLFVCFYFCIITPMQSLSLSLPIIVSGLGHKGVYANLMSSPPYIVAGLTCIIISRLSDHHQTRSLYIFINSIASFLGLTILTYLRHPSGQYLAVTLAISAVFANVPLACAWVTNNVPGATRRAVTTALVISVGNLGGVLAGQIFTEADAPYYTRPLLINAGLVVIGIVCVAAIRVVMMMRNKAWDWEDGVSVNGKIESRKRDKLKRNFGKFRYVL